MIISEETDKIFAALAKFQSALPKVKKAKEGHGYKYADLAGCIDIAKEPLANNGLAVLQFPSFSGTESTMVTVIVHESGQYIGAETIMEKAVLHGGAGSNPAQKMGASITYIRRYALSAALGIAQEDNDAANVSSKKASPQRQRRSEARPAPTQQAPDSVTTAQMKRLRVAYKDVPDKSRHTHASKLIGRNITSFNQLTKDEAGMIIDRAERGGK